MTIVAKIGDDGIYTPYEFKSVGFLKKETVKHQDFTNLNETIDYCKRHNGNQYRGLFDMFEFQRGSKILTLFSKCTYEEVFSWSGLGKNGADRVLDMKDEGSWEYRKYLRTLSLSLAFYKNPEGSETEFSIGQSDPERDAKIKYDIILNGFVSAERFLQQHDFTNFLKVLENIKKVLIINKEKNNIEDWNDFTPILEYFESVKNSN